MKNVIDITEKKSSASLLGAVLKGAMVSMVKYTILASMMPTTVAFIPVNNRAKILYRCKFSQSGNKKIPIRKLGSLFAFAREITFPINCTMSVSAIVGDTATQRLFSLVNAAGDIKYNCAVKLTGYKAGSTTANISYIVLKGAKIDSQNVTSSIGPNKAVTIELSAQIGKNSGLHMYGSRPA